MIAEQLAISLALLVAMGLVLRSRDHILRPDVGYDPNTLLVTNIDLASLGYSHFGALAFYDRLLPRLQGLPGVRTVALSSLPPFQGQRLTEIMTDVNGRNTLHCSRAGGLVDLFRYDWDQAGAGAIVLHC